MLFIIRFGLGIHASPLLAGFRPATMSLGKRQENVDTSGLSDEEIQNICKDVDFCQGQEVEVDELRAGTCLARFQGDLPAFDALATMRFVSPLVLEHVALGDQIEARVDTKKYVLTNFNERVMKPQTLQNGQAVVSVNMCVEQVLDNSPGANNFKGCQEGQAQGQQASAQIGNLVDEPGLYRVCALPSTESGICPIMAKAQRSAEHDCQYFVVKEGGVNGGNLELPGIFNNCQISEGSLNCNGQAVGGGNNEQPDEGEEEPEDPDQENPDEEQPEEPDNNGGDNGQDNGNNGGGQGDIEDNVNRRRQFRQQLRARLLAILQRIQSLLSRKFGF